MLKLVALAVAVTVAGPAYSGTVDDTEITRAANRPDASPSTALRTLVERQWMEGEAAERGIVVTSAEVNEAFAETRAENYPRRKDFERFLRETKQTEADVKATVRTDLLIAAIRAQVTEPAAKSVTPDQVKAYVDANPQVLPATRTMRFVARDTRKQAKAALKRLQRGATFSAIGGTKEQFAADQHPAGRAMFRAPLNKTVRWGVYVFRVIKHSPERPRPRAEQEATAWEVLAGEAQQRALDAFTAQFTAKWRERTTCAAQYRGHEVCGQPPSGQETP